MDSIMAGYLLAMRMLMRKSRELDRQFDLGKIRQWKDDED
jgi:hypothetical protein